MPRWSRWQHTLKCRATSTITTTNKACAYWRGRRLLKRPTGVLLRQNRWGQRQVLLMPPSTETSSTSRSAPVKLPCPLIAIARWQRSHHPRWSSPTRRACAKSLMPTPRIYSGNVLPKIKLLRQQRHRRTERRTRLKTTRRLMTPPTRTRTWIWCIQQQCKRASKSWSACSTKTPMTKSPRISDSGMMPLMGSKRERVRCFPSGNFGVSARVANMSPPSAGTLITTTYLQWGMGVTTL
mmetsp:Transcript_71613/g.104921  ORF Transcript_71613/g.104921 Transcript_71613/m.104921 type:complete len:238 (+) Transcript_71613:287-1000(+)